MQYIGYVLLIVHLCLLVWSSGGFLELILPGVPWQPYTNPDFPNWLLPIHWGSALVTSMGFLYGYFTKWSKTPRFMMFAYATLALLCAIETFWFMTSQTKYIAMITEYVAYTLILFLLFKNTYFVRFFGQVGSE